MDFRTAFKKRAVQLFYQDGNLGIPRVVSNLEKELESLKGFLGDAEERQDDDKVVREWMYRIKELVAEAHEITEKHLDRIARYRQIQPGFWNALVALPRSVFDASVIVREASKISHLSDQISGMASKMKAYGIEERQVVSSVEICDDLSTIDVETRMVVGLDEDTKMLVDQLVSITGSSTCRVIGIYGVNGLGKTTLAKEVFNSNRVADHFDAKTWAFVGQEDDQFPLRDVLQNMIRDLGGLELAENDLIENDLIERVRRILTQKKCLVVLDDLQITARWDQLKAALSTESSSKLVVTACDPDVLTCVDSHIFLHQLRLLNFKQKWELFLKITGPLEKGTRGFKARRKWQLLIQHTAGLPLTILVLAGLWKGNLNIPLEWRSIVRQYKGHWVPVQEGRNDHDQSTLELEVELALRSSLRALRLKLWRKPFLCLLQMTHYPVGLEIPTEVFIANWIRSKRGIFKRMRPSTARIYAEKCLDDLVRRGLIQVVAKEGGNIKYCQLHSVIRDFSIRVEEDPASIRVSNSAAFMSEMGLLLDGLGFVSL